MIILNARGTIYIRVCMYVCVQPRCTGRNNRRDAFCCVHDTSRIMIAALQQCRVFAVFGVSCWFLGLKAIKKDNTEIRFVGGFRRYLFSDHRL